MPLQFPYYQQHDTMDCGPTCLKMIAAYYGQNYTLEHLRSKSYFSRNGVSLKGIMEAAETIGFRTMSIKVPLYSEGNDIVGLSEAPLPCIVHWNQKHFVVVYKYSKKYIWIADPASGKHKLEHKTFQKNWISDDKKGIALLLETTPQFFEQEKEAIEKRGFGFLIKYLSPYKKLIFQLSIGLLLGSLFQLVFPFLTQSIVDVGIQNQNIGFIWLILIAQLMVFVGQTGVSLLQSWILLHISTRINISLVSDFLVKLMKLPIGFFDTKMIGDLLQRIGDHKRIESFLTGSTLNILFSLINLLIFGVVLLLYNSTIFLLFLGFSVIYFLWIFIFLKKRKEVDYQLFSELSQNQSTLIELINGMQEIKLQNSEHKHKRYWTNIQARLFNANIRSLSISQYQDTGANSINRVKDILISFIAAKAVIEGSMTLGMMLAVQYIVGQLNTPLYQMIGFIRTAQDAKISLERLNEIHGKEEEEKDGLELDIVPKNVAIRLDNVNFRYNELDDDVLKEIDLTIPAGKVTAIVGTSGSGKTTLVKLLLGFYKPRKGSIKLGNTPISSIKKSLWREKCGAVMQDGYIFSNTIANNIAESDESVDKNKLLKAVKIANIQEFIEDLPLSYNTNIGAKGNGISQGQRQRLLIARAVYKNPDFLFFDEATNALDSKNEKIIVENLDQFFAGKTVVIIAHRLSTVKNADQIVVLEKGELKEIGTHQELVQNQGLYFKLIKDQLELGN
ncbi:peptidase domain-containing ABC transporter [Aureispira sp. CCB-QB1]|uniref:peptidase domain-containing ABC transporter n=1 Tax=Aureispira sp. CCB-QB1 TaxID=1313421 RepID=UPI0006971505|nr:peptidase domain-containing ABC transporter [Aureispira sp. CCB-QB1]